jgi:hypothetical protein
MPQKRRFSLEQSYSFVALRDTERERESERQEQSDSFVALRDRERDRETEMANLEMCRRKRALLKDPIGKAKVKHSWSMFSQQTKSRW